MLTMSAKLLLLNPHVIKNILQIDRFLLGRHNDIDGLVRTKASCQMLYVSSNQANHYHIIAYYYYYFNIYILLL